MPANKLMTKPKRRAVALSKRLVAGGVLTLTLAGIGLWKYVTNAREQSPARATEMASAVPSPIRGQLRYGLQAGKVYTFRLRQETRVLRAGQPYAEVNGAGQLEAHVIESREEALDLIVRIRFEGAASSAPKEGQVPEGSPVKVDESAHVRIAPNGQVLAFDRRQTAQAATSQTFASLLGTWLYVLPHIGKIDTAPEAGPFYVRAVDGTGDFQVRYDLEAGSAHPLRLVMRKERYHRASALTRIVQSEHQLAWNLEAGHLLSAKRIERLEKGARELQVEVAETGQVDYERAGDTPLTRQDLRHYTLASSLYAQEHRSKEPALAIEEGKVRPWEELKAALRALSPNSEATLALFDQVANSLVKHPELLPQIAEEATAQPSDSEQYRLLIGAIAHLGTREAQNALIDLYDAKDEAGKDMVLKAQALLNTPASEETRAMLLDSVDHGGSPALRSVAGLALGSALRHAQDEGDESVSAARARIASMWSGTESPNEKSYALQVMGNSGDPHFLGVLKGEILNSDSPYRSEAVSALRFMKDDESAQLLGQALRATHDPRLQQAAADALTFRSWRPEFMEPVVDCFLGAAQSDLRIRCARAALQQPSQQQEMHALLEKARKAGNLDETLSAFIDAELM